MDTREAGSRGGRAGTGAAKRRGDSDYYRALRATGGYTISAQLSGGLEIVARVGSLSEAKRIARRRWDAGPCRWVQIDGGGRSWTSCRRQAAGMSWA